MKRNNGLVVSESGMVPGSVYFNTQLADSLEGGRLRLCNGDLVEQAIMDARAYTGLQYYDVNTPGADVTAVIPSGTVLGYFYDSDTSNGTIYVTTGAKLYTLNKSGGVWNVVETCAALPAPQNWKTGCAYEGEGVVILFNATHSISSDDGGATFYSAVALGSNSNNVEKVLFSSEQGVTVALSNGKSHAAVSSDFGVTWFEIALGFSPTSIVALAEFTEASQIVALAQHGGAGYSIWSADGGNTFGYRSIGGGSWEHMAVMGAQVLYVKNTGEGYMSLDPSLIYTNTGAWFPFTMPDYGTSKTRRFVYLPSDNGSVRCFCPGSTVVHASFDGVKWVQTAIPYTFPASFIELPVIPGSFPASGTDVFYAQSGGTGATFHNYLFNVLLGRYRRLPALANLAGNSAIYSSGTVRPFYAIR